MGVGILIGYFAKHDDARKALGELARRNFHRTALVHKRTNGEVHIRDTFLWRRAYGVALAAIFSGGIAGVAFFVLTGLGLLPRVTLFTLTLFMVTAPIGALAALLWLQRSRYGVE